MLSVGGNREDSEFSAMIKNHANRKEYVHYMNIVLENYSAQQLIIALTN